ncbi:unnamed protein product [Closterium sp. NIES-64]|nr:unnamed protein product [Closterium sp. NIES-64]
MYPAGRVAVASLRTLPTAAGHIVSRARASLVSNGSGAHRGAVVGLSGTRQVCSGHPNSSQRNPPHAAHRAPCLSSLPVTAHPYLLSRPLSAHRMDAPRPSAAAATAAEGVGREKMTDGAVSDAAIAMTSGKGSGKVTMRLVSFQQCSAKPTVGVGLEVYSCHPLTPTHCPSPSHPNPLPLLLSLSLSHPSSRPSHPHPTDGRIRLASFQQRDGEITVGVVRDARIWPLHECVQQPSSLPASVDLHCMASVIAAWPDIRARWQDIRARLNFEKLPEGQGQLLCESHLLAPLPRPAGAIMCIGKNYEEHVKEVDTWKTAPHITQPSIPTHPIVFTKAPQSVTGPGTAIRIPHGHSESVDYEAGGRCVVGQVGVALWGRWALRCGAGGRCVVGQVGVALWGRWALQLAELAVIIGKPGRGIKADAAMDHVFGYTILNDVTARDVQKRHQQWFLGKSCDTFCPMGPWIVPASEINGQDLHIRCWINDELRQNARTTQLIFPIPTLIATISAAITLQPGDIIATGTPAGVGSGFDPQRHLKPGDSVRIQIENVGELTNRVD